MDWPSDDYFLSTVRTALRTVVPLAPADAFAHVSMGTKLHALDIDSLEMVHVLGAVEEEIGCTLPDEELAKAKTIGDLATIVRKGRLQ